MALLEIDSLEVRYRSAGAEAHAVDRVSLTLDRHECLGLIGESGCGKSTLAKAVMGILPRNAYVAGGSIRLDGRELVGLSEQELRPIRAKEMALIPQAAMNGFDPVYTIWKQLRETMQAHAPRMTAREMRRRAEELFVTVGLPITVLEDYPHQLSGGMRQRAMIAMALLLEPKLLLADEPTTGLDVLVQDQILESIAANGVRAGKAMLLVTHDMGVVAENCDQVAVMYAGRIVEHGDDHLLESAQHPYTLGLCNAFPNLGDRRRSLVSIPGSPPSLFAREAGCCFRSRCPFATERCLQEPPLTAVSSTHAVACHYIERAEEFRQRSLQPATWQTGETVVL